jgi:hypothetical protein
MHSCIVSYQQLGINTSPRDVQEDEEVFMYTEGGENVRAVGDELTSY